MQSFEVLQRAFGQAILAPDRPTPSGLSGAVTALDGRFDIYRNNVMKSLNDALADTFPVVCQLLGDEFFAAVARAFVVEHPPASPALLEYGAEFADFLDTFPPVRALTYLTDVARIERAWLDAYHAADAPVFDSAGLASLGQEALTHVILTPHASVRVVRCRFAVLDLWLTHVSNGNLSDLSVGEEPEEILVLRPLETVELFRLPRGCADFIDLMMAGTGLFEAAAIVLERFPLFDLSTSLRLLLDAGAIGGFIMEMELADVET